MINGKLHILITDYNKSDASGLKTLLRAKGNDVDIASSLAELVVLHEKKKYDVIFMDMALYIKLKDEINCVRTVRDIRPDTKLILMSNGGMNEALRKAMFDGVYGCIHKPYEETEVMVMTGLER